MECTSNAAMSFLVDRQKDGVAELSALASPNPSLYWDNENIGELLCLCPSTTTEPAPSLTPALTFLPRSSSLSPSPSILPAPVSPNSATTILTGMDKKCPVCRHRQSCPLCNVTTCYFSSGSPYCIRGEAR